MEKNESILSEDEYAECLRLARRIDPMDKRLFCPNFYYVFYGELELNLNRYFAGHSLEQWSLLFVDYNFLPSMYLHHHHLPSNHPYQIFPFPDRTLQILINAKIKYCCVDCRLEWTSARGRAIFQAELPRRNQHNILFAYLYTQHCRRCRSEIQPSWYLDEVTRVMKLLGRIVKEKFYSAQQWQETDCSSVEEHAQRPSEMRTTHPYELCQACQVGTCFGSNWKHQRRR